MNKSKFKHLFWAPLAQLVEQRPCTEAVSSLQQTQVLVPAGPFAACHSSSLSLSLSLILFPVFSPSCSVNEATKAKTIFKKTPVFTFLINKFCQ